MPEPITRKIWFWQTSIYMDDGWSINQQGFSLAPSSWGGALLDAVRPLAVRGLQMAHDEEKPTEDEPDRVRERIAECATACLDHVRAVAWGQATSEYKTNDGARRISVHIEVKCFERAKDDADG